MGSSYKSVMLRIGAGIGLPLCVSIAWALAEPLGFTVNDLVAD